MESKPSTSLRKARLSTKRALESEVEEQHTLSPSDLHIELPSKRVKLDDSPASPSSALTKSRRAKSDDEDFAVTESDLSDLPSEPSEHASLSPLSEKRKRKGVKSKKAGSEQSIDDDRDDRPRLSRLSRKRVIDEELSSVSLRDSEDDFDIGASEQPAIDANRAELKIIEHSNFQSSSTTPVAEPELRSNQSPKVKLGRIPKKKSMPSTVTTPVGSGNGTPSSSTSKSQANQSASCSRPANPTKPSNPKLSAKINPITPTNDVDLRDASVYSRLFGSHKPPVASSKPNAAPTRPNISISLHKEKDANRRAELRKLRDEDREARLKGTTTAAFLYEQHNRITKFEERLKARDSAALLGPNILAGAFRNWSRR